MNPRRAVENFLPTSVRLVQHPCWLLRSFENKRTIHDQWPSFNSPQGKAIRYGSECCPRTIDIIGRYGGVITDPNFTDDDVRDMIAAIRKVYLAMTPA